MDHHSKPATCTNSTSAEFVGYIHVSPVYNKKFFECQLQTITRVVCFSPRKHKIFTDYSGKKSSIRVKKFNADTSSNTNDMLMGDTVIVEHYPQLDSPDQRFNLQPCFHQSNQCLKAKVTNMSKKKRQEI